MSRLEGAAPVLAILVLAMISVGFFQPEAACREDSRIKVITTLFPQFDFTRQIGKDKVEVSLLLPPGVEAHSFEPKPRDIARINEADIFVYTGKAMEPWARKILDGAADKELMVVDASRGAKLIGNDPHIWLDMDNAAVMVDNITRALISKDPAKKDFYKENANSYKLKLKYMDARFRAAFSGCAHQAFVYAGHPAFGYFAARYGLTCVSPYKGFCPDSEPSPKAVMGAVDAVRKNGIKYVFYEELLSPKLAETVARETHSGMLPLNGAHNVSKQDLDSGVTFLMIMEKDLENLKKGMECKGM